MKYLEYGMIGEENIAFELKNSHMPMYILHDVYLDNGELSAQIDYLVFTRKLCFVIECKNLIGDIEINKNGDFIRTMEFNGRKKREGIYSPITQNQRHLELMKKIKVDSKENRLIKYFVGKYFEGMYQLVVVLSNPKTILNSRFAKKEIKEKVIRVDQLINYIKMKNEESSQTAFSDEELLRWAQSYLDFHKEVVKDYSGKYKKYKLDALNTDTEKGIFEKEQSGTILKEEEVKYIQQDNLFEELKLYRLMQSKQEKIKPYFIYNNRQLDDLILKMPKTMEELQRVDGFGEIKSRKYGDDILRIVNKYIK